MVFAVNMVMVYSLLIMVNMVMVMVTMAHMVMITIYENLSSSTRCFDICYKIIFPR